MLDNVIYLAILAIVGTTSLVLLGVWRLVRDWYEEEM